MYNTQDAYDLYVYYLAIKRHFTSSYDFVKYHGKINAKRSTFDTRKDKYHFFKLSKRKHAKELILANMIADPSMWIGDLFDDKAEANLKQWQKQTQSLGYLFKSEIANLDDDFNKNFVVPEGDYPYAVKLYNRGKISLITLIILTDLTGCLPHWNQKISDNIVWPTINTLVGNTKPFLTYDREKLRQTLLDRYND